MSTSFKFNIDYSSIFERQRLNSDYFEIKLKDSVKYAIYFMNYVLFKKASFPKNVLHRKFPGMINTYKNFNR